MRRQRSERRVIPSTADHVQGVTMKRRHLIALAATAAATPALAIPAGASAAESCYKQLPGPGGVTWATQQDGAQDASMFFQEGTNFQEGHGQLKVNGVAYPMINEADCTTTATSITYPQKTLGGVAVSRHIASVDGRIRRMDVLVNQTDAPKSVDVSFAYRVLGSQRSIESSSGDTAVTSVDFWSVHENNGNSNPFLQWGDGDAPIEPAVVSLGDEPGVWQQKSNTMPDADLRYENIDMPANSFAALVHVNGTTGGAASSQTAAEDMATPFKGLSKQQAARVKNWGNDPDGDGVSKSNDECPGVNGNQANGCLAFDIDPGDGDGDTPKPPAGDGQGTTPGGTTPGGNPQPGASDTTAPVITLSKLNRRAKRSRLTRKGLAPRVRCNEACSITVKVKTRKRGARKAKTVFTKKATERSTATRTLRLKLKQRHLRRLAKQRVTLVITATDAAGNRRSVTRVVRLGR